MVFWENKENKKNREPDGKIMGLPLWIWGMLTGILFLGIGAGKGQFAILWRKAVMICMECIGIG